MNERVSGVRLARPNGSDASRFGVLHWLATGVNWILSLAFCCGREVPVLVNGQDRRVVGGFNSPEGGRCCRRDALATKPGYPPAGSRKNTASTAQSFFLSCCSATQDPVLARRRFLTLPGRTDNLARPHCLPHCLPRCLPRCLRCLRCLRCFLRLSRLRWPPPRYSARALVINDCWGHPWCWR